MLGAKAYSTANLESAWIPSPFPAIFPEEMKVYREWLDVKEMGSLGESMDSADISEYYDTPYDIGYGRIVAFDHDFVGREALEEIARSPRREKVEIVRPSRPLPTCGSPGTPTASPELPGAAKIGRST